MDRDPVSAALSHTLAVQLALARHLDESIEEGRRTIELDPSFAVAYDVLGGTSGVKRDVPRSFTRNGESRGIEPRRAQCSRRISATCVPASVSARRREGFCDSSPRPPKERYTPALAFAVVHLGLGENDQALNWLEKAYEERFNRLAYLRREPVWDPLRPDPRFARSPAPHQPARVAPRSIPSALVQATLSSAR